jgi:hypothetical protein
VHHVLVSDSGMDGKEPPDKVDGNRPLGGADRNGWPEGADEPDDIEKLGQVANFCLMLVCRSSMEKAVIKGKKEIIEEKDLPTEKKVLAL